MLNEQVCWLGEPAETYPIQNSYNNNEGIRSSYEKVLPTHLSGFTVPDADSFRAGYKI